MNKPKLTVKKEQTLAMLLDNGATDINKAIDARVLKLDEDVYSISELPKSERKTRKTYTPLVKNKLASLTRRADGKLWIAGQCMIDLQEEDNMTLLQTRLHYWLQEILDEITMQSIYAEVDNKEVWDEED